MFLSNLEMIHVTKLYSLHYYDLLRQEMIVARGCGGAIKQLNIHRINYLVEQKVQQQFHFDFSLQGKS